MLWVVEKAYQLRQMEEMAYYGIKEFFIFLDVCAGWKSFSLWKENVLAALKSYLFNKKLS